MRRTLALLIVMSTTACHVSNRLYNPVPRSIVALAPSPGRVDTINPDCQPRVVACMAFLEFDEMGEAWNKAQLPAALGLIDRAFDGAKAPGAKPPIIVTFVHGWKNNANDETGSPNGNVVGFEGCWNLQKVLFKGYPIVGIYVGWRGDLDSRRTGRPPAVELLQPRGGGDPDARAAA